jgi:hypothetical protein
VHERHTTSSDDLRFREQFESCAVPPDAFDHRAHVRLAYVYLTAHAPEAARSAMRDALRSFLLHNCVDPAKYHETITSAWIAAVRHFMDDTRACESADEFIHRNPRLLDTRIMTTHYSAETLFSPEARARFVAPDLEPIPRPSVSGDAT